MYISIIVPVYNVEKYIERCIQSCINQKFDKDLYEIILVNDGSTDKSVEIINKYLNSNVDMKLINKINGGLSDARNVGLENASGKYILFLDSDDSIELNTCKWIKDALENIESDVDVLPLGFRKIQGECVSEIKHSISNSVVSGEFFLKNELKNGMMYMAAWSYVYRRDFLIQNELKFKKGILHEDEQFTPRVLLKAKKVLPLDYIFYNYYINPNTITTKKNKKKNAEDLFETLNELEYIYNQLNDKELVKYLNNSLVEKYLYMFCLAQVYKNNYLYLVNKNFVKNKSFGKTKLKVILFLISPRIYSLLHEKKYAK